MAPDEDPRIAGTGGSDEDERAWQELLSRLRVRTGELSEELFREVSARGLYPPEVASKERLLRSGASLMTRLIARLGGEVPPADSNFDPTAIGAVRARQGLPLDSLTEATRAAMRVVWRALRQDADETHAILFADRLEFVMAVIDDFVAEAQRSYLHEEALLRRDARLATSRDVTRLLSTPDLSDASVERIAANLGVSAAAPLCLLVFGADSVIDAENAAVEPLLRRQIVAHMDNDVLCLFWALPTKGPDPRAAFAGIAGVAVRARNLRGLPRAVAAGRELLRDAGELDRLREPREIWASLAAARLNSLAPGFTAEVLSPLGELGDEERDRVLSTVRAYLDSGSVKLTAEREFCHRNTVVNRLATFRARTGLDVAVPTDAALAVVALHGAAQ